MESQNNKQLVGWHFQPTPRRDFSFRPSEEKLTRLHWRNKQKGKCQAPRGIPQRLCGKTENSSFHLLQLDGFSLGGGGRRMLGWTFREFLLSLENPSALILPHSSPHPCFFFSSSQTNLACVISWSCCLASTGHTGETLELGMKSGGILSEMRCSSSGSQTSSGEMKNRLANLHLHPRNTGL